MIDEPPASSVDAHAYHTDASKFANRFAKLLYDMVCQSNAESAKLGYTQVGVFLHLTDSIS